MQQELETIAALSRHFGTEPGYVFLGGGNCSVKNAESIYVKPSGCQLASLQADQLLPLVRAMLQPLFNLPATMTETERDRYGRGMLAAAVSGESQGRRPSVEALVHEAFKARYVMHLHPLAVNGMTCAAGGREACRRLFPSALWLDYCNPGMTLALQVRQALQEAEAATGAQPALVFLQNHGVFAGAESEAELRELYAGMMAVLQAEYRRAGVQAEIRAGTIDSNWLQETAPRLRGLLAAADGSLPMLCCAGNYRPFAGPLTPDHIVYAKSFAYSGAAEPAGLAAFTARHGYAPKVIEIAGQGIFCVGSSLPETAGVRLALDNALGIEQLSLAFGGPRYMNRDEYGFIESWEAESYRRSVSVQTPAGDRLQGRVCVVTGAAQGFGLGIAECLVAAGGVVVLADMNAAGAAEAAARLCAKFGADRAFAAAVNVASEESVAAMLGEIVRRCGGLDLFVANAGVLRAGSVLEMSLADWEFVTDINYNGYFICVKHAARVMARQHVSAGSRWSDIVQVNSKSGLEGSNKNGAYAGSKFGGIGLTQSFAKELVESGIKVNSVCPGNYYDGPLWSHPEKGLFVQYLSTGKVPGAKTIDDVRRFYEDKVPMRRGCLPDDVAKAIVYCVEQNYETGQAIPVTGGQVMLH